MSPPELPPVAVLGGGDPETCQRIIQGLPERCGLAIVVACPHHARLLASLRASSPLPVTEVTSPTRLTADHVFVIPSDLDAVLQRGDLVLEPASDPHAPLDRLLRSIALEVGRDAAAVLLGDHGRDGVTGMKRFKEAGGLTIARRAEGDPALRAHPLVESGLVDVVLPTEDIAPRLCQLLRGDERFPDLEGTGSRDREETLREILAVVRVRTGHDFSAYKRATLFRRVARRMQVCQADTLVAYLQHLRDHPTELAHLLRDFLISVTNFFRDPEAFAALDRTVIPKLFVGKTERDQVRVWVPGCATGEEAYSIAMLLCEHAQTLPSPPRLLVFATDIDEDALSEARLGCYPETIASDVSRERLSRFFVAEAGQYRVSKELRELVLFSPHNVLRDPPFSRLDLISCRNLLIYLNREAQDRVLKVFHFGLRPDGFLFLGSSESAENNVMFEAIDPRFRLFSRRMTASVIGVDALVSTGRWHAPLPPARPPPSTLRGAPAGELHHRVIEQYAPPSVLIDEELSVLHFSESAGRFMQLVGGEPTRDLLRLVHPALQLDLRTAIHTVRQAKRGTETRLVRYDDEGTSRLVELRIRSVELPELGRGALLVTFDDLDPQSEAASSTERTPATKASLEPVVREIEDELRRTRDQLRTTVEQYETSLEELKASNEELQAINEELRSATEELETSKEELQSVNEELTTLNHELKVKVDEVSHANADLQNLMSSTDIGVVFLDRGLNIKRFTPRVQELINVLPSDLGRPLAHLTHRLESDDLPALAQSVLQHLRTIERDLRSRDGRRYLARLLPYRSLEDRIDGVVLTFVDVTDLREAVEARARSEAALLASEERLRFALRAAPMVVFSLDEHLQITWAFAQGEELALDPPRLAAMFAGDHADRFTGLVREVIASRTGQRAELELVRSGVARTYDFRIEPAGPGVTAIGFDITPSKEAELSLREADRRKDEFLATLSHELRNPLTPLKVAMDVAKLTEDPDVLAQSRAIMERQVEQLTHLVDELLDLSRITQGKITIAAEPLEIPELAEAALEAVRPLIQSRRHQVQVELPRERRRVLGDFSRLTQVLTNLLGNAAKFTPEGGHIELRFELDQARDRLVIRVRDDGIGLSSEQLSRIFEIFVQCRDDQGRAQGGLGIGLNLVQRLVELHGGSVLASSEGLGRGSEFTVVLPLVREEVVRE